MTTPITVPESSPAQKQLHYGTKYFCGKGHWIPQNLAVPNKVGQPSCYIHGCQLRLKKRGSNKML
jgi:hypothetical protein